MTSTSEGVLRELPLFAGLELSELQAMLQVVDLEPEQGLWRQGQPADGLYVIEHGQVAVTARLPGQRELTLATLGTGQVLGELGLLHGGVRTASVRALQPTRLLRFGAAEFRSLVLRRDRDARAMRQRLIALACSRLRDRHRALAATLAGTTDLASATRGQPARPPHPDYLLRLPFFRQYSRADLDQLLTSASVECFDRQTVLVAEGEHPRGVFVTLNGAVEEVIRRDGTAIRAALAGPGRAFGYAGLIAGGSASVAAAARERSVVLVIERDELEDRMASDPFAASLATDVVHALRQAERRQARLAVARPRSSASQCSAR